MLICDYCKKESEVPSQHNLFMTGQGDREIIAALDLCKGCAPIYKQKLQAMTTAIKKSKHPARLRFLTDCKEGK